MFDSSTQTDVAPTDIDLKRVNLALNMRRFYRMSIQPDLFGGASLVREWGRIGYRGRTLIERHKDEGDAVAALLKLSARKSRRGYRAC
jgi:predicted DNA-binding WGR domain protein